MKKILKLISSWIVFESQNNKKALQEQNAMRTTKAFELGKMKKCKS